MPYYLYRIMPLGVLRKLDQFDRFAEASARAKALRAADAPGTPGRVKVMFAENELQAEDLLGQVREAGPAGDD
ncbi:MAG: hypothetical protein KIT35_19080 [Piscinibacter sp.]|uniref:hypothetical protein n=1 Tax=Piscinibacter sp. TaxID=1903157 RepID=UPI0025858AA2|nr:hypothetical protein [Piscinibacter sp.]MCW5665939.1 hypothetical protein [Piscinibacter sp.]